MIQSIKLFFISVRYRLFNTHYKVLKKSLCFDSNFYLARNQDVAETGLDPLVHYVEQGWLESRQPCSLFDTSYYLSQVPWVKEQGQDPLFHFLTEGWKSGKKPNLLFDPLFYAQHYPDVDYTHISPLTHYLKQKQEPWPSPYFSPLYYKKRNADLEILPGHALEHFLSQGLRERRESSLFFDLEWYADNTPVLLENGVHPLNHYFDFGIGERKSPCPVFDAQYYEQTYDVFEKGDLFIHYLNYGAPADHRPCSWFDPVFYRERYLFPKNDQTLPFEHFLDKGIGLGFYPNREVAELAVKPVISLIVPVYNAEPYQLNNCIRSVLHQSYPHWELCLADDCSTREDMLPLLQKWADEDDRIKVVFLEDNHGISGATNAAASLATGDYLGFLDNDDELTVDCLFKVVQYIIREKGDLYYSDEDLIGEDGRFYSVFNKPSFNPELLLGHNYITHFVLAEKSLYAKTGGLDSVLDGAQDYDLFLKLSELAERIVHIPQVLYHWRASESSTSINHKQKKYANAAGKKAILNALERRGIPADVEYLEWKFFYRVKRRLQTFPLVSICILSRTDDSFLVWLMRLTDFTKYSDIEYLVILENSQQDLFLQIQSLPNGGRIRPLFVPTDANTAARYNEAVNEASGEFVIFLNAYLQIQEEDWIHGMLEYGQDEHVGIVGGREIPFEDKNSIETLPDMTQPSELYYARFLQESSRHMNGLQLAQNVFAVSWNLLMINRTLFLEMNGFDEDRLGNLFADSDLCFRLQESGRNIVYTPFVSGRYLSRESEQNFHLYESAKAEKTIFQKQWREKLRVGDPFYNYNVLEQGGIDSKQFLAWYLGEQVE